MRRVAVIGAGWAGCAAAVECARKGHQVTLFESSRCADETHPKPHPAMLLELADELAVEPTRIVMIGDTTHDLEMAAAAGAAGIGVAYGAHPREQLAACAPVALVGNVAELREWLDTNR